MAIDHLASKTIAKLINIYHYRQPSYLWSFRSRHLVVLILLSTKFPNSSIIKIYRMYQTEISSSIGGNFNTWLHHSKIIFEAIKISPGMNTRVFHILIIGTILPDLRLFNPSPFTQSMFNAVVSAMLVYKLLRWDTGRRGLREY